MNIPFADNRYAVVESQEPELSYEVIEYVNSRYPGDWIVGLWEITMNGEKLVQPNPHKNNHGMWVWLLKKVG